MLSAARESIAVSSGSDTGNATLPDRGSAAESSSPEPSSSSYAAINILSSAGALTKMLGSVLSEDPANSSRNAILPLFLLLLLAVLLVSLVESSQGQGPLSGLAAQSRDSDRAVVHV